MTSPSFIVTAPDTSFGEAVAAGDFDGDGHVDLIVSAVYANQNAGSVVLYAGSAAGPSETVSATWFGDLPASYFGSAVVACGDTNGDGYEDALVGAPGRADWAGAAYLLTGGATGLSTSPTTSWFGRGSATTGDPTYLGALVAGPGDLDGDGLTDIALWTSHPDVVAFFSGSTDGVSVDPAQILTNVVSPTGVGDVNGDGYADLLVNRLGVGFRSVLGGPTFGGAEVAVNGTIGTVASAGDVDGDGFDDLLIARVDSYGRFYVDVHYGAAQDALADVGTTLAGFDDVEYGSLALGRVGDLDNDGFDDVAVGQPASGLNYAGSASVFRGSATGPLTPPATLLFAPPYPAGSSFGFPVMGADFDADGLADILAGFRADVNETDLARGLAIYPGCSGLSDRDGDGYDGPCGGYDCDDADARVYPSAPDAWYDGLDANCDGADDFDADVDGYRAAQAGGDDCDDATPATHPGATDERYDGVDSNCDGVDDLDADGDGVQPVAIGGEDCDDDDPDVYPGAVDPDGDGLDQACDGNNHPEPEPQASAAGCACTTSADVSALWLVVAVGALVSRRGRPC